VIPSNSGDHQWYSLLRIIRAASPWLTVTGPCPARVCDAVAFNSMTRFPAKRARYLGRFARTNVSIAGINDAGRLPSSTDTMT